MPYTKNLEAWDISENDFPHNASAAEKLKFCLNYAILAPSTYNTQPWFFEIDNDTVSVYTDRRLALPVLDPDDRQLVMSCAAALFNLRLAIRYFGYEGHTQFLPNPADDDLIARVQLGSKDVEVASEEEKALFKAIPARQMSQIPFKSQTVPEDILRRLKNAADQEGAWLYVCQGDERDIIGHFIAEADNIQMSSKAFRRELASWINERRHLSADGMPNYARSVREIMKSSRPRIVRRFETEPGQVVQDDEIAKHCPVIAILGSKRGGMANRVYAGQAYMRVLLQAQADGLSVSTLNQPCEVPDLRLKLYDEIEHHQGRPYIILRIGYAERAVNYHPRRPLSAVLSIGETARIKPVSPANDIPDRKKSGLWGRFQNLFLAK